jgi:hypothetical protein
VLLSVDRAVKAAVVPVVEGFTMPLRVKDSCAAAGTVAPLFALVTCAQPAAVAHMSDHHVFTAVVVDFNIQAAALTCMYDAVVQLMTAA